MKHRLNDTGRPGFLQLLVPYWFSPKRWLSHLQLALVIAILFGGVKLHVWANKLFGDVTDTLVALNWAGLRTAMLYGILAGLCTGAISVIGSMLTRSLDLHWRTWMTDLLLERWSRGHVYYEIERDGALSNADQRIVEDVRLFVTQSINIFSSLLNAIVGTVTFTLVLWGMSGVLRFDAGGIALAIPGYMVYATYAYSLGSLLLVHWVGKRLIGLNNERQTVEADYRHSAMQLRQNAEQVAFYGGAQRERQRLKERFEAVRSNVKALIFRDAKLDFTRSTYGHLFHGFGTLLALPRYIAGEITLGGVVQVERSYGALSSTLSYFSQAYAGFANWIALANRLRDLIWAMNKADAHRSGVTVKRAERNDIATGEIRLSDPHGRQLCTVAPLSFAAGSRWLVRGRSGAGKSTLLRAVAGLWPYGEGEVALPTGASLMFLPQRSYLPSGQFKAAMCYPRPSADFSDAECLRVLKVCGLDQRITSLTASDTWQQLLSGGEQQRVAFARVLLQRPDFVFLDEATSAVDDETETRLYQALISELPHSGIISVAHRASLATYHEHQLEIG